ncbi:MAG: hypothetical protein KKA90_03760 [Nanoarchaeota archaeon]|nr:hypothetical protein [Nanoarchaeota archaeon]
MRSDPILFLGVFGMVIPYVMGIIFITGTKIFLAGETLTSLLTVFLIAAVLLGQLLAFSGFQQLGRRRQSPLLIFGSGLAMVLLFLSFVATSVYNETYNLAWLATGWEAAYMVLGLSILGARNRLDRSTQLAGLLTVIFVVFLFLSPPLAALLGLFAILAQFWALLKAYQRTLTRERAHQHKSHACR